MTSISQEKLAAVLPEMQALLPAQWEHTGDSNLPCEPAWQVYNQLELADKAALFVARDDANAVGYAVAMYHPHLNSRQVWVGTISTYYVVEGVWRAVIMRSLLMTARDWLLAKGAQQVYVRTAYNHSAGAILERMGFTPTDVGYKLTLLDKEPVGQA